MCTKPSRRAGTYERGIVILHVRNHEKPPKGRTDVHKTVRRAGSNKRSIVILHVRS